MNPNASSPNYNTPTGTATEMSSDIVNFCGVHAVAGPARSRAADGQHAARSAQLFSTVGCVLCHSATLTSGQSTYTGMSSIAYHPYSDFAIHHMGREFV